MAVRFSVFALLALLAAPLGARAEEITVFAAGAVKAAVEPLVREFEAGGADRVDAKYDTVGALRDRALAGEAVHVVLLSTPGLAPLAERGKIAAASGARVAVGRTGIGLAGAKGRVAPIDTPAKFAAVLRAAKSVGYADPARGATAGTHFAKQLEALGLAGELKDRLKVFPFGVEAVEAASRGEIEIAVSQATEIVAHPDKVAFLGLFPDPHQLWTNYEAALLADTPAARRFLALLAGAQGQQAFAKIGFVAGK
jgi:molybdate transport system substrate-binding protein